MIHVGRGSTNLGSFSEMEVRQGLATQRFSPTDLGWKEGMAHWRPLSEFPELSATPPALPPAEEEAFGLMPADEPAADTRTGLPWELHRDLGTFLATLKLVLTDPAVAFSRMRITGGLAGPLFYNMVGGWVGLIATLGYQVLYMRTNPPPAALANNPFAITPDNAQSALLWAVVAGPLIVVLGAFIAAFLTHVFLMLVGGANKPFEATLRVICFTAGSAQVLQLIPVCGGVMSAVWQLICLTAGLSKVHEIPVGRAVAAVFLPLIVCCGGFVIAISFLMTYYYHHMGAAPHFVP